MKKKNGGETFPHRLSKLPSAPASAGKVVSKGLSPMTPAKVRARRESERQSLAGRASMQGQDVENMTPQRPQRIFNDNQRFSLCKPSSPSSKSSLAHAVEATKTSPLQAKDELRSPPSGQQADSESEALMRMSPMTQMSPSPGNVATQGPSNSTDWEKRLTDLRKEESALDSLHGQLRSALHQSGAQGSLSTAEVDQREREGMQKKFQECLEALNAKLENEASARDEVTFELAEACAAKQSLESELGAKRGEVVSLQATVSALQREQQKLSELFAKTEQSLRASRDQLSSEVAALRLSNEHVQSELEIEKGRLLMAEQRGVHVQMQVEDAQRKLLEKEEELAEREKKAAREVEETGGALQVSLEEATAQVDGLRLALEHAEKAKKSVESNMECKEKEWSHTLEVKEKEWSAVIDGLRAEVDELARKSKVTESRESFTGTQSEQQLHDMSVELHTSLNDALDLSDTLKQELDQAKHTILSLQSDVHEREQELGQREVQQVQLEEEIMRLKGLGNELIANILEAQKESDGRGEEATSLKHLLEGQREEVAKLQGMLKDTRVVLQETRVKLEDTSSERNMWREQVSSAEETLSQLTQDNQGLRTQLSMSQEMLENAENEHEKARAAHELLLKQAEERLEREQQCWYDVEARNNEQVHSLSEQLKQAQAAVSAAALEDEVKRKRIESLSEAINKMKVLHKEFQATADELRNDRAVADAAVKVKVSENQSLSEQVSMKDTQIMNLKQEVADTLREKQREVGKLRERLEAEEAASASRDVENKKQLDAIDAKLKEAEASLLGREGGEKQAKEEASKAIQALEGTKENNAELLKQVNGLLEDVRIEQQKRAADSLDLEKVRMQSAEQREVMEVLSQDCDSAKKASVLAESKLKMEKERNAERESELTALASRLRKEGEDQSRQVLELLDTLDKSKKAADVAVQDLQEELRVALQQLETAKMEITQMRRISSELQSTETVLAEMQDQMDRYQATLANLQVVKRELEVRNQELASALESSQRAWHEQEASLTNKIQAAEMERDRIIEEHGDAILTCGLLKDAADAEKAASNALAQEHSEREQVWRKAFDDLKKWAKGQVCELNETMDTAHGYMMDLTTDIDSLQATATAESNKYQDSEQALKQQLEDADRRLMQEGEKARAEIAAAREELNRCSKEAHSTSEGIRLELEGKVVLLAQQHEDKEDLRREVNEKTNVICELEAKVSALGSKVEATAEECQAQRAKCEQALAAQVAAEADAKCKGEKVDDLTTTNKELEKERTASIRELENLEGQMSRTLDSMNSLIASKDREMADLKVQIEASTGDVEGKMRAKQLKIGQLEERLDEVGAEREREREEAAKQGQELQGRVSKLEGLLAQAAQSVCAEQETSAAIEQRLDQRAEEMKRGMKLEEDALAQLAKVEDSRRARERAVFYEELRVAQTMLAEAEAKLHSESLRVSELSENLAAALAGKSGVEAEKKATEAEVSAMREMLSAKDVELQAAPLQSQILAQKVQKYGVLLSELEISPSATPSKGVSKIVGLKNELQRREAAIKKLTGELESEVLSKQGMMSDLCRDFARLKDQVSEQRGILDQEKETNKALQSEKSTLQEQVRSLDLQITSLQQKEESTAAQAGQLAREKELLLIECQDHVGSLESRLEQVMSASQDRGAHVELMQQRISQLQHTCAEQEAGMWENQVEAEKMRDELTLRNKEMEKQRDELQEHYMQACRELLGDTGALPGGEGVLMDPNMLNMSDYVASSTPQDVKLVTDAPQRKEATKRRIGGDSPALVDVLSNGKRAVLQLSREKAELEAKLMTLQESLAEEGRKRVDLDKQVTEMNEMMHEERMLVLEERERMAQEMTDEKRKMLIAFTDMLNQHKAAASDTSASGSPSGNLATPLASAQTLLAQSGQPLGVHFEGDSVSEASSQESVTGEDAEDKLSGARVSVLSVHESKIRAVMIRVGSGTSEATARRLLEHTGWDTGAAVSLARDTESAVLRGLGLSPTNSAKNSGIVSATGAGGLLGAQQHRDQTPPATSGDISAAPEAAEASELSFLTAHSANAQTNAQDRSDLVDPDHDICSMYAEAALQASRESPIRASQGQGRNSLFSFASAHGRSSLSLSPESLVRKSLNGPRFLF